MRLHSPIPQPCWCLAPVLPKQKGCHTTTGMPELMSCRARWRANDARTLWCDSADDIPQRSNRIQPEAFFYPPYVIHTWLQRPHMASKVPKLGCTLVPVVRPLCNLNVPSINTPAPDC